MPGLPVGTLTFPFTDIEGSTEGDAFFAVFPSAVDAVRATIDVQQALAGVELRDPGGASAQGPARAS